jgi:hypothetical protein
MNRALKRIFVAKKDKAIGRRRELHNELHNLYSPPNINVSRDSSVDIPTRLQPPLPRAGVRLLAEARDFSLLDNIQTGSGLHSMSYSIVAGQGLLPRG